MIHSTGFAGIAMCLPHVYREIYLRVGQNDDLQSEQIMNRFEALVTVTHSYVASENDASMVTFPEKNHTTYAGAESVKSNVQTHIGELLGHVCAIGETAARLLADMYFYAELIDSTAEPARVPSGLVDYVYYRVNSS